MSDQPLLVVNMSQSAHSIQLLKCSYCRPFSL